MAADKMKIGERIGAKQFYGKKVAMAGTIVKIEEVIYEPQSFYRGMDVITIDWDDGTTAKFHREDIGYPLLG